MFCPSKSGLIMYNIIMAHVRCTNTQLIFREAQYSKLKFVTENANATQSWNRPQIVLMETNAFWTNIVEKVVNVKGLVLKDLGNYLSFAIRVFWEENFYFQGIKDNLYSISMEDI